MNDFIDAKEQILNEASTDPDTVFPLLVPECFLIEPTEAKSRVHPHLSQTD